MFLAEDGMRLSYQMKQMMMNPTVVYKTDVITGQEQGCCKAGVAETVPDQLCI